MSVTLGLPAADGGLEPVELRAAPAAAPSGGARDRVAYAAAHVVADLEDVARRARAVFAVRGVAV